MAEHRKRRADRIPLLRFGPGLLLAIVAGIIIWSRMPRQPGPPPGAGGPPQVIHEPAPASPAAVPSAPEPGWLLERAEALDVTPIQAAKLSKLKARWDKDTRDLRTDLAVAEANFQQQMREDEGKPASMRELQARAVPVSELSRQLASARQAWWSEAATVLTQDQRRQAETMWAKRFEGRTNEKS